MKTQLTELNDVSCPSEFDPALILFEGYYKKDKISAGFNSASNLRSLTLRKLRPH